MKTRTSSFGTSIPSALVLFFGPRYLILKRIKDNFEIDGNCLTMTSMSGTATLTFRSVELSICDKMSLVVWSPKRDSVREHLMSTSFKEECRAKLGNSCQVAKRRVSKTSNDFCQLRMIFQDFLQFICILQLRFKHFKIC